MIFRPVTWVAANKLFFFESDLAPESKVKSKGFERDSFWGYYPSKWPKINAELGLFHPYTWS